MLLFHWLLQVQFLLLKWLNWLHITLFFSNEIEIISINKLVILIKIVAADAALWSGDAIKDLLLSWLLQLIIYLLAPPELLVDALPDNLKGLEFQPLVGVHDIQVVSDIDNLNAKVAILALDGMHLFSRYNMIIISQKKFITFYLFFN